VHIDALDGAAALAGIEHRAIDQILDRVVELGIGADIGRVLAAQFQAEAMNLRALPAAPHGRRRPSR